MADGSPNIFEVVRAQRDGGHWRDLTELEAKVLLVYASRADVNTCEAFPSIAGLAADTGGANEQRLREVIDRLQERGLLVTVFAGGGRGQNAIRKLVSPAGAPVIIVRAKGFARRTGLRRGPAARPASGGTKNGVRSADPINREREPVSEDKGGRSAMERGPVSDGKGAGERHERGPVSDDKGVRSPAPELPIELPIQQPTQNTPPVAPAEPEPDAHPEDPAGAGSGVRMPPADPAIDAIYDAYPRKTGRGSARQAIRKAIRRLALRGPATPNGEPWSDWLVGQVRAYAAARERATAADPTERRFTPHPATWFNAERYDDDPAEWEPIQITKGQPHANGHRKLTAEERGQHPEPQRNLPEFGKTG